MKDITSSIEQLLKNAEEVSDGEGKPLYWLIGKHVIDFKDAIEKELRELQAKEKIVQKAYEKNKGINIIYIKEKNKPEKIIYNAKNIHLDGNMFLNFIDQDNKEQSVFLTTTMQVNITKGEELIKK